MRQILRRSALAVVLVTSVGIGFSAAMPLRILAPDLVQMTAARNVVLATNARLTSGQAEVIQMTHAATVGWRIAGIAMTPPGVRFAADIAGALNGQAVVHLRPLSRTVDLSDVSLRGAMEQLVRVPLVAGFGDIEIALDNATFATKDRQISAATGTAIWRDAALRFDDLIELGRVEAKISTQRQGILILELTNSGADLRLRGTLRLDQAAGMAEADLVINPGADASGSVRAILDARGVPEGDATRIIQRFPLR